MKTDRPILLIRNIRKTTYGGGETYQLALARELKKLDHKVIILTSNTPLQKAAKKHQISVQKGLFLPFQNWSGLRNFLLPLYALWQVILFFWYLHIIHKYRPEVLHIQSRDDMIAGTLAGHMTKTKVIWTDHTDLRLVIWENVDKKYKNPIGKFILKLAKYPYKITTVSDYEYKYITNLIKPRKLNNFIVVKNGAIDELSKYQKIKPTKNSICYVGRIIDYKGTGELIDAFNETRQKFPDATLNLYGDGPDLPLFKYYAEKNLNIHFKGYTNNPLKAIAENEIFVLPSYHEGLSLSLLDAAMLEKPIIATNIDGNPEVVKDKKTGLLIPMKDEKALKEAIEKLLQDKKLAEKFAKSARKLYEQEFDFQEIVKNKWEPLYYG